jgi:hypothetical protein
LPYGIQFASDLPRDLLNNNGVHDSVSDPCSFFTDPNPDPEVEAGYQYGSGSGSRALMTKNLKKITAEKKKNFLIKNCNLPIPRPP